MTAGAAAITKGRGRGRCSPRLVLLLLSILGLPLIGTSAAASMRMVATTTDLASLAEAITGDLAQVETIIPPAADPEAFEPRPSDLAKLKGASIVVRVGLGYDHWLDKLLSMQGDAAVNRGGVGYVDASVGIPLLELKGLRRAFYGLEVLRGVDFSVDRAWTPPAATPMRMASPIHTIGSILPMQRSSAAELQKP